MGDDFYELALNCLQTELAAKERESEKSIIDLGRKFNLQINPTNAATKSKDLYGNEIEKDGLREEYRRFKKTDYSKEWEGFCRKMKTENLEKKLITPDCFYTEKNGRKQISFISYGLTNVKFWKEYLHLSFPNLYKLFDTICGFFSSNSDNERHFNIYTEVRLIH